MPISINATSRSGRCRARAAEISDRRSIVGATGRKNDDVVAFAEHLALLDV
ncbi:hypothetical protein [Paenibacillus aceti]|uniref:hypothetical protein n=1 Tax=Paenibacillus aceti TaxID=1820010 RepID=UPI001E4BB7A4|nr:hypothetical protein [Paenibacillus aceti]